MMSPQQMTCAVVGAGRMGVRHVDAAKRLGMNVVGVSDIAHKAALAACEAHGLPASVAHTDTEAMLRSTSPLAVVIATTAPSHCQLVLAAAERGARYILCEKPMASSIDEAHRMITACRESGARLAVNHQMRFMPQYTRIKALIGSDELGPLSSILVAGSNFGLAMNASHYFEMFRYITDSDVGQVRAWFEPGLLTNPRGPQFEDRSGRLLASSAQGTSMFIDFSMNAGHGLQCVYICRHGQIVVDELDGEVRITARQAEHRELPTTRYGMPADVTRFAIEPADTVLPTMGVWRAMLDGATFPEGGTAGMHALLCLAAAHLSDSREGRPVPLDDIELPRSHRFPWA